MNKYDPLAQPIVADTWAEKYRYGDEPDWAATCARVVGALCRRETAEIRDATLAAMEAREIIPAGRVLAGAGTGNRVTLINCFVGPVIQDSISTEPDEPGMGIMDALRASAVSQQMGGGIGNNFSTVRPRGAVVKRTQSVSSGVLPFMRMWDAMCATIRSSGGRRPRRGAMMGTLGVWHPDILEFIEAKQAWHPSTAEYKALPPERREKILTNFNISILITDEFMDAVAADADWHLTFPVPPATGEGAVDYRGEFTFAPAHSPRRDYSGYVYRTVRARELWRKIVESTYIHAEPGIIFIDRVNALNNLAYCEEIECTNPCGEQPLPPDGCCDLGHVNLAAMVADPFKPEARFRWDKLGLGASLMVRLLDNVLDETLWPTPEQKAEAEAKRRIGLGFTGLGTALQMLGIRYGSPDAVAFARRVACNLARAAYFASCELARERGAFPLYDEDKFCSAPFVKKLDAEFNHEISKSIRWHGIRNGVLLSVAPTGTTSLVLGNISSGIEPVFAHRYRRKVRGATGELDSEYSVFDYGYLRYCEYAGIDPEAADGLAAIVQAGFVTADQLTVGEHLLMVAAVQEWVDAAVSKTINCPESMTLDEFEAVYARAYSLGMKGCTTYRPDPRSARGSVLTVEPREEVMQSGKEGSSEAGPRAGSAGSEEARRQEGERGEDAQEGLTVPALLDKVPMQDVVEGRRYRIRWPTEDCAYYVIITDYVDAQSSRRPFELFISTKSERHSEWVRAFSLLVTAIFRREGDPSFVVDELRSVFSAAGGAWLRVPWDDKSKFVPSLVAAVGLKIEEHMRWLGLIAPGESFVAPTGPVVGASPRQVEPTADLLAVCEQCGARAVLYSEGCSTCRACGRSDCG